MSLNLAFVAYFLGFLAIAFVLGYIITRALLGPQAARQNLLYAGPWLIAGAALAIFLSAAGRYGLVSLYILYAAGALGWLVSWPWRKRPAGELLHQVGRTSQSQVLLWLGLFQVGLAIAMTLLLLDQVMGGLVTGFGLFSGIAQMIFWWSLALLFTLLGRSHLEIREHGLCYMYSWQPWERVEAFGWDDDKPNTLILKVIPRSFISRRFLTLNIPASQKDTIDNLIDDYLAEADLATELDIVKGIEPPPSTE